MITKEPFLYSTIPRNKVAITISKEINRNYEKSNVPHYVTKINMKKASIAVIKRGDLFLTVSRRNDLNDMGFPGGKIEGEETEIEGLVREVEEETGIRILSCRPILVKQAFEHEVHVFEALVWSGQPQSIEGTTIKWLTSDEILLQKSFGTFNRSVLEEIDRRNAHENLPSTPTDAAQRLLTGTIPNSRGFANPTTN
jgi:mutator protein MutT